MMTNDPFELPEIRVQRGQEHPSHDPASAETREQRLTRLWIEAWQAKRQAEETMARLRKEIEPMLDDGVLLESSAGTVSWAENKILKAEPLAMARDVGLHVFAKASTVSATRLRELIQGGLVANDAPYLSFETVRRLITTLR